MEVRGSSRVRQAGFGVALGAPAGAPSAKPVECRSMAGHGPNPPRTSLPVRQREPSLRWHLWFAARSLTGCTLPDPGLQPSSPRQPVETDRPHGEDTSPRRDDTVFLFPAYSPRQAPPGRHSATLPRGGRWERLPVQDIPLPEPHMAHATLHMLAAMILIPTAAAVTGCA